MKYVTVLLLFCLLGTGEYALVEYYPLAPYQRIQRLQKVPLVGRLADWYRDKEMQRAEETIRKNAEAGNPWSAMMLYRLGKSRIGAPDMERATELLAANPSATARFLLRVFVKRDVEMDSREGILLTARYMIENVRHPEQGDAAFDKQTARYDVELNTLFRTASDGDADARWVIKHIDQP